MTEFTLDSLRETAPHRRYNGEESQEHQQLIEAITGEEATLAAKRLRSHRALGPHDIAGELIKCGAEEMHEELA